MVARLCYEEARNMDNLTDCVNTDKERGLGLQVRLNAVHINGGRCCFR